MLEKQNMLNKSTITCKNCGETLFKGIDCDGEYLVCSNGKCGSWSYKIKKLKQTNYNEKRDKD
jgi:hypothetical protein